MSNTGLPLYARKAIVTIQTLQIQGANGGDSTGAGGLDLKFSVKRNLKPQPNTCDLTVFNLNAAHRSQIEQLKTAKVQVEAGYENGTSVIFNGDLRTSLSVWDGPTVSTALSSGDGEKAIRTARISVSVKKGSKTADVLRAIAAALGVGQGNLNAAVSKLTSAGFANLFTVGTVLTGSASREMTNVCRSSGLTWSIQNGALQLLPLRQFLDGTAIMLTPKTGMVGSPTVDNDGLMSVKMLMMPDVIPGRKIVIQSDRLQGQYRIEEVTTTGDTAGTDWYHDVKGKRY